MCYKFLFFSVIFLDSRSWERSVGRQNAGMPFSLGEGERKGEGGWGVARNWNSSWKARLNQICLDFQKFHFFVNGLYRSATVCKEFIILVLFFVVQMETASVLTGTRYYVMAVTPTRLYSFTGTGSLEVSITPILTFGVGVCVLHFQWVLITYIEKS